MAEADEFRPVDKNKPYADLLHFFQGKKATPESVPFEKKLIEFSDRSIQLVLSRKGKYLAYALYGCSIEFICKILDNVSRNRCMDICEQLMQISPSSPIQSLEEFVIWAQKDIIETIEVFEKSGEIIKKYDIK